MSYQCKNCGTLCEDYQSFCTNCGAAKDAAAPNLVPDMPMKWYKFVIYFQLFASCVLNVISAISTMTGGMYMGMAEEIYSYAPAIRFVDIVYGVALICLGVYAIMTRTRLKNFCEDGPKKYLMLLLLNGAVSAGYTIVTIIVMTSSALGPYYEADYTGIVSSIASAAILYFCNKTYFNKRAHLFVN